jgi:hypothetical protein
LAPTNYVAEWASHVVLAGEDFKTEKCLIRRKKSRYSKIKIHLLNSRIFKAISGFSRNNFYLQDIHGFPGGVGTLRLTVEQTENLAYRYRWTAD